MYNECKIAHAFHVIINYKTPLYDKLILLKNQIFFVFQFSILKRIYQNIYLLKKRRSTKYRIPKSYLLFIRALKQYIIIYIYIICMCRRVVERCREKFAGCIPPRDTASDYTLSQTLLSPYRT